eukprot:TRINITY_DN1183_c0_g1_i14.p1 TRINITY_DN1183_c0_g1~~TRINITY_DN1183_c0_g1_i14.p1  ORF type:complete len:258 (+),score=70.68 TRINITY_DN1183_c0_g1_i14:89-775(+)
MSVNCTDPAFVGLRAFGIVYLIVYGSGGLYGLFVLLRRNPDDFKFMTQGYKPERYYWDIVITLRQIVFVVVSLYASAPLQLFFGTWILLLSWVVQHYVRPYEKKLPAKMDSASMWVLLVTVTVGNLFYTGILDSAGVDGYIVSVLLILLNFVAVVAFVFLTVGASVANMAPPESRMNKMLPSAVFKSLDHHSPAVEMHPLETPVQWVQTLSLSVAASEQRAVTGPQTA